jgi:hypothetical protein
MRLPRQSTTVPKVSKTIARTVVSGTPNRWFVVRLGIILHYASGPSRSRSLAAISSARPDNVTPTPSASLRALRLLRALRAMPFLLLPYRRQTTLRKNADIDAM